MESAMKSLCFFRPRAITITSPVGGSEGGTGIVEGTGEDGAGDEGRDGGGGGQGQGEARGEGGDVIAQEASEGPSAVWDGVRRLAPGLGFTL